MMEMMVFQSGRDHIEAQFVVPSAASLWWCICHFCLHYVRRLIWGYFFRIMTVGCLQNGRTRRTVKYTA